MTKTKRLTRVQVNFYQKKFTYKIPYLIHKLAC